MNSNIEKEPLKCPKCGHSLNDDKHKCDEIPPGKYNGDGDDLGNHIIKRLNGENKFYGGKFENHPFYYPDPSKIGSKNNRNGIEAHHLITNASLKKSQKYQALVYMLGYNINHRNNGVLLPSIMEVACTFGVPLHRSHHKTTFVNIRNTNNDSNLNRQNNIKVKIKPIFPIYIKDDEIFKMNYENKVKMMVAKVCERVMLEEICDGKIRPEIARKFIYAMDSLSEVIFKKIRNFQWTITSDGLNYSSGNIGCCGFDSIPDQRKFLKKKLKGVKGLDKNGVKGFWVGVYSSEQACDYLTEADFRCIAGTEMKNHHRNPTTYNFYQERENIEKFQGFK